ncbi:unnamed protein product [Rhizophagus irregularis]|nr:unnamed protein product [Rhizophagus irregularis]
MQSKINSIDDIIFDGYHTTILIMSKRDTQKYTRNKYKNKNVALKCLYNSQNITSEFLNEAKLYSIKNHKDYYGENKILKIYGISQNPDTKEYIIVLDYAKGGNLNYWMDKNYSNLKWSKN